MQGTPLTLLVSLTAAAAAASVVVCVRMLLLRITYPCALASLLLIVVDSCGEVSC